MNISQKQCDRCFVELPMEHFPKNKRMKNGHFNQCKGCRKLSRKKPEYDQQKKSISNREYFEKHSDRIKLKRKERYSSDLEFRLSCNLRNRLSKMVRGKIKNGSAIKDLGCTIDEFKSHLEKQFKPGMNWLNYGFGTGKWNIDHIIPISSFDLSDKEQFLKACHYSNLQPLWHIENIKKSDIIKT